MNYLSHKQFVLVIVLLSRTLALECAGQVTSSSQGLSGEAVGFVDKKAIELFQKGDLDGAIAIVQEHASELLDAWSLGLLGWSLIKSDPEAAKHYTARSIDFNASIEVVEQAMYLAYETSDAMYAAQVLKELYSQNPHMTGGYSASSGFELPPNDLEHGKKQIETLLVDRPALTTLLTVNSPLYEWTIRRLAGEFVGTPIHWLPVRPDVVPQGYRACHNIANADKPARVWVSAELEPDKMLSALVFELLNAEVFTELKYNSEGEYKKGISLEDRTHETVFAEHKAILRLRAFWASHVLSGTLPEKLRLEGWHLNAPLDRENFLERMSQYPAYMNAIREENRRYFLEPKIK